MLIQLDKDSVKFSQDLLGTDEAWVWVSSFPGPPDNDDARVRESRALMQKYYPYIPSGMWVGNKEGEQMIPLKAENGFYALDVSWWPVGIYRMNLHTAQGEASPHGSPLHPEKRDQDCSWAPLENWKDELRPFLHQEENGAGYSLRFLIRPDRTLEAFSDKV